MADDMVAELTLRLRNELNAGMDEIRGEFGGLDETLKQLTGVLDNLSGALADLRAPVGLAAGFDAATAEAEAVITAAVGIGAAIDEDIVKIGELSAAWEQMHAIPMSAGVTEPGAPVVPTVLPPGAAPAPDEPLPPDEPDSSKKPGETEAIGSPDMVTDLIALGTGYEAFKGYAGFSGTLGQITNTEHLYNAPAEAEQSRISDLVEATALRYNQQSKELLDAYYYLITTGMKPEKVDALLPSLAEASTAHGIDVTDMEKSVMALANSYDIPPDQMGAVLGQLGYATKMGHFTASNFSDALPGIGGALSAVGVKGEDAADYSFAALESIVKNVSIPSEAATDYTDFIHYIGTQHAERSFLQKSRMMLPQMREIFSKYKIGDVDLWGMENAAQAEGKDPVQTVLDFVHNATKNMTPVDRNAVVTDYFTNQQGGDAVRALMQYWNGSTNADGSYEPGFQDNYQQLKTQNQASLDNDFHTAVNTATGDMNTFSENLSQLGRTLGHAFDFMVVQPANFIISPSSHGVTDPRSYNSGPDPAWLTDHRGPQPIEIHLRVSADGQVTSAPTTTTPGVNVKVNQGPALVHY